MRRWDLDDFVAHPIFCRYSRKASNWGAMKLSKGFIEKHLSHKFCVDVDISVGALDAFMSQHLFDLIYRSSRFQEILGIGMAKPIS